MSEALIKKVLFRLIILFFSIFSICYILFAYLAFGYGNQNPNSDIKLTPLNFLIPLILTIVFILTYNVAVYFKIIKTNDTLFTFGLIVSAYCLYWMIRVLIIEIDIYNLISFGIALFCIINVNLIIYKNRKTQSNTIDSVS